MNQKGKTILILAGLATISMHVINRIQYSRLTIKNILTCPPNNYYEWRFGKIRYFKKGSGTPLLLLHDLSVGSSCYEYHNMLDALAKNHEVYALDLLGYGLSDKINMTYTNYLYVQLITDFIKNVIGRKTDIAATGDTAPICVMACHNDPEVFNKMIFINPQSLYLLNLIPSKQTKALKFLLDAPILGTFVYNILTTKKVIEKNFKEEYFYDASHIDERDIQAYLEASHTRDYNSKFTFSSYIARYTNSNIIHALKEINHSMYIIAGDKKSDSRTIVDNYIYYNSSIEAEFIDKTKLLPHMEKPNEVIKCIEMFLS